LVGGRSSEFSSEAKKVQNEDCGCGSVEVWLPDCMMLLVESVGKSEIFGLPAS
jgi:hypothetical protein